MTQLPIPVQELLDAALVGELTVIRADGRPVTYPLIPLIDEGCLYMTSSVLFSRKVEHMKANPRVSFSVSDPAATRGLSARVTIQGDARISEEDTHTTWERLLPIWLRKEPAIDWFYKNRVGFPLFFERSVIELVPRRVYFWPDGDTARDPEVTDLVSEAA
jgi:general stress protein 26